MTIPGSARAPVRPHKPKILVFVGGYLPGYRFGGPLQSIANLVDRLGDEFDFRIVTADRDLGSTAPYPDIVPQQWHPVGQAQVLYLAPAERRLAVISRILRETPHHALYLNSFFNPHFSTLPLVARRMGRSPLTARVILAPRGEFAPGALQIKQSKKRVFLAISRLVALHRNLIWQASTQREADDIRRATGPGNIVCATDLPRQPAPLLARRPRAAGEPLRIVFLSRISPMKNLLYALEALAEVKAPVVFTIHGPREDEGYWQDCAAVIARMPSNIEIVEGGPVEPADVVPALAQHDLFFLPTQGENYGHVIGEALEAGLRILISDRTPWRGLAAEDVGDDLPLGARSAFVQAIEQAAARRDRIEAAERSYAFLAKAFDVADTLEANRMLLASALPRDVG
ncbi:glycosyltransferase [Sphingomonas hankookensis]|uniref:Glycosyl transferase family 1 n=1 Tax=Sphingomonas hengshuiensis TaxID=1609977 RepID=A0A2W4Z9L9_9SPHN|nr:MAG: hypothetical protein DI632_05235 [Sphingomonas hengshuiensis]